MSFKSLVNGMGVVFFILLTQQLSGAVYLTLTPQFKPRVEIAVVYIEYNDLTLILHRQQHKPQGDKWGIPGGKIDKNETPLQAAIREVREETGFDISNQIIEELATVYVEYNEKDHFIHHMFRTKGLRRNNMLIWLAATIDLSIDRSSPVVHYGGRHDLRHLNGLAHPNWHVISSQALSCRGILVQ